MVKPAKTKRKNSSSFFSFKGTGIFKKILLYSLPTILSLTAAGLLFGGVIAYALNSSAFQLSEVKILNAGTMTPEQMLQFCDLQKGVNLVSLDLVNIQQEIKRKHPEFREVLVRRVLPNRIEIILKRRTPVAQAAFTRFVQLDKDLVLLPGSSPAPFKNLTIIEGSPIPREGLAVGAVLNDPATEKAMSLVDEIKRSNILRKHFLSKINIADPNNITFYVDQTIEIRIGNNRIQERLKILDQTLKSVELDSSKIRYIDLRFDDVVIGPR